MIKTQYYIEDQPMIIERKIQYIDFKHAVYKCNESFRKTRERAHRTPQQLMNYRYLSLEEMRKAREKPEYLPKTPKQLTEESKYLPKTLEQLSLSAVDKLYGVDSMDHSVEGYTNENLCIFKNTYIYRIFLKCTGDYSMAGVQAKKPAIPLSDRTKDWPPERLKEIFHSSIFSFKVIYTIYGNKNSLATAGSSDKMYGLDKILENYVNFSVIQPRTKLYVERKCCCAMCNIRYQDLVIYMYNAINIYCLENPCPHPKKYIMTCTGEMTKEWASEESCNFDCTCWLQARLANWVSEKMRFFLSELAMERVKARNWAELPLSYELL